MYFSKVNLFFSLAVNDKCVSLEDPPIDLKCKEKVTESDTESQSDDESLIENKAFPQQRFSSVMKITPSNEVTHRPKPIKVHPCSNSQVSFPIGLNNNSNSPSTNSGSGHFLRPLPTGSTFQPTGAVFKDVHSPKVNTSDAFTSFPIENQKPSIIVTSEQGISDSISPSPEMPALVRKTSPPKEMTINGSDCTDPNSNQKLSAFDQLLKSSESPKPRVQKTVQKLSRGSTLPPPLSIPSLNLSNSQGPVTIVQTGYTKSISPQTPAVTRHLQSLQVPHCNGQVDKSKLQISPISASLIQTSQGFLVSNGALSATHYSMAILSPPVSKSNSTTSSQVSPVQASPEYLTATLKNIVIPASKQNGMPTTPQTPPTTVLANLVLKTSPQISSQNILSSPTSPGQFHLSPQLISRTGGHVQYLLPSLTLQSPNVKGTLDFNLFKFYVIL